jgi:SAM-dependent methyltransferase
MTSGEPTSDYDVLAENYDRAYDPAMDGRVAEIAVVKTLVDYYQPNATSLLDLGTGTGRILREFRGRINELVGVDSSPGMLDVARQAVPEATLVEADISSFDLGREFDVELCLFNTINHLHGLDTWGKFFKTAERHLSPGGILIFDIMSLGAMQALASYKEPDSWQVENGKYTHEVKKRGDGGNDFTTSFTLVDESTSPSRVTTGQLHQSAYALAEVENVITGLEQELAFDFIPDLVEAGKIIKATDNSIRPTFVYRKPAIGAIA